MKGLSEGRWQELQRHDSTQPGVAIAVIITLVQGASPGLLTACGMHVHRVMRSQNIVTGQASFSALKQLAALPEVVLIEEDGMVRAIAD